MGVSQDGQDYALLREPALSFTLSGRILHRNITSNTAFDDFIPPEMGIEPSPWKNGSSMSEIDSSARSKQYYATGAPFTPGSPPIIKNSPLNLDNFMAQSRRVYEVIESLRVGDALYTDRTQLKWSYLPPVLR